MDITLLPSVKERWEKGVFNQPRIVEPRIIDIGEEVFLSIVLFPLAPHGPSESKYPFNYLRPIELVSAILSRENWEELRTEITTYLSNGIITQSDFLDGISLFFTYVIYDMDRHEYRKNRSMIPFLMKPSFNKLSDDNVNLDNKDYIRTFKASIQTHSGELRLYYLTENFQGRLVEDEDFKWYLNLGKAAKKQRDVFRTIPPGQGFTKIESFKQMKRKHDDIPVDEYRRVLQKTQKKNGTINSKVAAEHLNIDNRGLTEYLRKTGICIETGKGVRLADDTESS